MQMTEFENLKKLVTEIEEDVAKAAGGNKAAGVRVRQAMQKIKSAAQEVRLKILEGRDPNEGTGE
jgi:Histone H1-like protein Hc1